MPTHASIRSSWLFGRALPAALALPLLLAATPAAAEIIPAEQMARGISMTPQQCSAQPLTVWVTVANRGYCVRYYMSTAGGEGSVPVVFLQGDRLGNFNLRTQQFNRVTREEDVDTDSLQRMAENLSKQTGTTAIYLARLGVEGSSGFHGHRKTWLELYVVNAALEAIKQRYGYEGYHLAGQSGGAGLVGGLVVLRADIGCAVPGAGRLALLDSRRRGNDRMLELFDPSQEIARIAGRRSTRILVVTDSNDKNVPVRHQTTFVQALRRAGGNVEQFFVQAADDNNHAVRVYTFLVAAHCVRGKSREEITTALARLQERHLAAARERRQRQAGGPQTVPPAGAPASAPRPAVAPPAPAKPATLPANPPATSPAPIPAPAGPQRTISPPPAPPRTTSVPPQPRITLPVPARPAATPSRPTITPPPPARTAGSPARIKPDYLVTDRPTAAPR